MQRLNNLNWLWPVFLFIDFQLTLELINFNVNDSIPTWVLQPWNEPLCQLHHNHLPTILLTHYAGLKRQSFKKKNLHKKCKWRGSRETARWRLALCLPIVYSYLLFACLGRGEGPRALVTLVNATREGIWEIKKDFVTYLIIV